MRPAIVAIALAAAVLGACDGAAGPPRDGAPTQPGGGPGASLPVETGSPAASPIASPPGTPVPLGSPSAPDVLPAGLPAPFPGATVIRAETLTGTTLVIHELLYDVPAGTDDVRAHYRRELRSDGWRIGEVELDGTEWEIEAARGGEEIEIEIEPAGPRSLVELSLSVPART